MGGLVVLADGMALKDMPCVILSSSIWEVCVVLEVKCLVVSL